MNDVAIAIMDAAEQRIRLSGFNGFSFREIAADVGVKSSSVHYHFPTKARLAAAVVHRYADRLVEHLDRDAGQEPDTVRLWVRIFRGTLRGKRMCPCIVLGAAALDLPSEVAAEVQRFFGLCLEKMIARGLAEDSAAELLSTITGAMVVANALGDIAAYDRATGELMRERDALAARL